MKASQAQRPTDKPITETIRRKEDENTEVPYAMYMHQIIPVPVLLEPNLRGRKVSEEIKETCQERCPFRAIT